ncbi:hypothetical protein RUM43_001044 [Polyplax serrata]|uniref:Uncharacterized protein n=1 Tax=Polyplax serrata TaxID=468196 RepID=A0AAN8XRE8_POLSC
MSDFGVSQAPPRGGSAGDRDEHWTPQWTDHTPVHCRRGKRSVAEQVVEQAVSRQAGRQAGRQERQNSVKSIKGQAKETTRTCQTNGSPERKRRICCGSGAPGLSAAASVLPSHADRRKLPTKLAVANALYQLN